MHRFFGALLPLLVLCNFNPVYLRKISHPDCLPGLSENEFAFEGNGYVALENRRFEPTQFIQIEFSFKTSVDQGLVYFTITPDGHSESLELRNGKVIYQFQVNSSLVEMATEKRYDDGKWHVLEVWWNQEETRLIIDDNVESVAGYPEHFKSLNYNSAVYFGGFKGQHNIGGTTAKGFNGSIKDVLLGGTSRRLSMHTEMSNARSGCPRRWRRQTGSNDMTPAGLWPDFHASYNGSTNVELRWDTTVTTAITTSCYESFLIQWHKLEEANETVVHYNKTVTDYLVEIDELEPNTIYTFTLSGRIDGGVRELKTANYSTLNADHPSLIVTSVTNSSLSVRWKSLDDFVVSLSGNSANISVTNGTNYIFENLKPGSIYDLKLVDKQTNASSERKVVTIPELAYDVDAIVSDTDIDLQWQGSPNVEVMYRNQGAGSVERCKLKTLSGTSGSISDLSYGCMYKLDVYAVNGARRIGSMKTMDVGINAKQTENFTCNAGVKAGEIDCEWLPRPQDACFTYQLTFSPSDRPIIDKTSGPKMTVGSLIPGRTYSISIQSIAGNGNSTDAVITNATAKTGIRKHLLENMKSTTDSITLQYVKDDRFVIDYYNVTSNETSYLLNDSYVSVVLENLEAGHCYSFTAYAVSQDIPSETINFDICTVPNPPSSVECQNAKATSNSVLVAIVKPNAGFYDDYDVTVSPDHDPKAKYSYENISTDTVNTRISGLRPYADYTITVKSVLKDNKRKSSVAVTKICKTAEGIPGQIRTFYNTSYGPDTVSLSWHPPYATNGVIIRYIIRISKPGESKEMAMKTVSGTETSCQLSDLNAGEAYNFSISAQTNAGEGQTTSLTVKLKEKDSQPLFIALALLLAILFTVLIALLVFYYIRKSPQRMMSLRRASDRFRHPTDQIAMFPQPSYTSKPIKLSEFLECLKLLERDSGLKFTEEYEDLKFVGRNQSRDEAELQCNRVKNRFTNILPYDISRVKLLPMEDEDGSDYINANWIPGFHSKREFIATQGPLPSTINDFWRMVWENNCQAIVMLTQCIEKGHIKCEQYWPFDKEPVFYGDLKVEIQNETKTAEWSIVEFNISLGAQTRKLKHFHYVGWPDMYVPEKTSLLAFVHIVRESVNTSNSKGSVVVHCSAGVGRTGTFIALDTLLLHIQDSHDLDVYGIVFQMRMNRVLMVQTEVQYVFIYECLNQVLEGPTTGQVEKIKEADTNGDVKTEASQEEQKTKELESKPNSDSKEVQDKKESESKSNRNSKEVQEKKESELKSNHDSKEKQNEKDLDSKSNRNSKEEQNKKESESKHSSDSKDGPTKTEIELKPIANSKEEPNKKELEPNSDSNEKKMSDDTANNPDPEPAKETAKNVEDTNK